MKEAPVLDKESLMIIKVVSKVLDQLIAGAKTPASNLGLFVKFQSSYAPDVSVQSYLERIRKYSGCSDACFVMSLIYIDRLIETRQLMLSQLNVHRLLVTSVMLAAKYHDDLFYNNAYYAKLGGLPLAELNLLEVDFLKLMGFSLFIDQDHYGKYYQELRNYFACLETVSSSASLPSPVSVTATAMAAGAGAGGSGAVGGGSGGGAALVRASTSCPNLALAAQTYAPAAPAAGGGYRVPSPHKPHDKASVNVSNEFYFGGYAAAAAAAAPFEQAGVPHAASVSPDFVDGSNSLLLVDYSSPSGPVEVGGYPYERDVLLHRLQLQRQVSGGSDPGAAVYCNFPALSHPQAVSLLHQMPSSDSVAAFPYYLSPQESCGVEGGAGPVRQVDHSSSCSWHRSAALMPREESALSVGLSIDTSVSAHYSCGGGDFSHLQYLQQQQLEEQQQQSVYPAYHRGLAAAPHQGCYAPAPSTYSGMGGGQWFAAEEAAAAAAAAASVSPHRMQQLAPYMPAGGPYVEVPMVVDIHGQLQGAFVHPSAHAYHHHHHHHYGGGGGGLMAVHQAPAYVAAGGPSRYHPYQRQHSV